MARTSEEQLKRFINTELDSITPDMDEELRLLEIHKKLNKRSDFMKFRKNKLAAVFTAMLVITVLGTVTAVAAGKITGFISTSDENAHSSAELRELSKTQMQASPKIPDNFSNGMSFVNGYIAQVKGVDDDNNQVITYSEAYANYGSDQKVTLTSNVHQDLVSEDSDPSGQYEVYQGITLTAREEPYLFLPEGKEPAEEDKKLEEEGKLTISYGSGQEERKLFRTVSWSENGIDYLLFTFSDKELNSLTAMAKEVIDMK
ncbi:MAG: hypothetical protein F8N38_08720 [Hungatella sp.]|nr:hypothetical protein [Hungatella sp.]